MRQDLLKHVVVCADDYALNAPVSHGIVALSVLGRLSATSVMSLSPRWAEDVAALREVRERLTGAGHEVSSFAIVGSGPNSASPHHEASSRVINAGDAIGVRLPDERILYYVNERRVA